jgi:hypothetical protein
VALLLRLMCGSMHDLYVPMLVCACMGMAYVDANMHQILSVQELAAAFEPASRFLLSL